MSVLQHSRGRIPILVNPNLVPILIWQTNWNSGDGAYSVDVTKTGQEIYIDWGDGSTGRGDDQHYYADSTTKTVKVTSIDGFGSLTQLHVNWRKGLGPLPTPAGCPALTHYDFQGDGHTGSLPSFAEVPTLQVLKMHDGNQLTGSIPSFAMCTALVEFDLRGNPVSGTLPSFAACTLLEKYYTSQNSLSGTLPSFNTCTALKEFLCSENLFSGALPTFAACTALELFHAHSNDFTSYTSGCFSTQKNIFEIKLHSNSWNQANVDACLSDLVDSLGGGRVTCNVELNGEGMATPSAQGIADHDTLEAAGWTVEIN